MGSRPFAPKENYPPTLKLTQTRILTGGGGNFPRGELSGHRLHNYLRVQMFLIGSHQIGNR